MPLLSGTSPNQTPTNADLGSMAFQDENAVAIQGGTAVLTTNTVGSLYQDTQTSNTRPTLLLDFAKSGRLDPRITYSRASTASFYDGQSQALSEQNLWLWSQDFTQASWNKTGVSLSPNATIAPDGTLTATKVSNTSTTNPLIQISTYASGTANYTASFYAKQGTERYVQFYDNGSAGCYCVFDLQAGTVTQSGVLYTGAIVPVGNGWYRCIVTISASAYGSGASIAYRVCFTDNKATPGYGISTITTPSGLNFYLWGMQLEQRSQVTAYLPTTSATITNYIPTLQSAVSGAARFDYDPITSSPNGFLIEESKTNLTICSEHFDNSIWNGGTAAVSANVAIAPDGQLTADMLTIDSINNSRRQTVTGLTAGLTYTFSCYVKAAPVNSAIGVRLTTNNTIAWNTGGSTYSVLTSQWQRISVTWVQTTTTSTYLMPGCITVSGANDSTCFGNILVWGAQLEVGGAPTSYIATPLTFTGRASTATYVGDNGYIQYAGNNVPRYQRNALGGQQILLESAGTNPVSYTQRLNLSSAWTQTQGAYGVPNSIIAPDGTFTGQAVYANGSGLIGHWIYQAIAGATAGATYTVSVYVKKGSTQYVGLLEGGDGPWHSSYFDLNAGTVSYTSVSTATITPAQNGWYRITCTVTRTSSGNFYVGAGPSTVSTGAATPSYVATGAEFVYLWGFQCEAGAVATSYIPSIESFTSRAGSATYYDASSTATAEQNLITWSQDYSQSIWSKSTAGVVSAATVAPDGTMTASKVRATAATGYHAIQQSTNYSSGITYTLSVYAKAAEYSLLKVSDVGSGTCSANFDLVGVSAVTAVGTGSSITSVGNGWYRCSVTFVGAGLGSSTVGFVGYPAGATLSSFGAQYTGDGLSGIYIWGAQLEQRSSVSAYTPTTSSAITNTIPVMQTAATNVARNDYDPVTRLSKGLLLETAATNLVVQSAFASGWTGGANATIATNQITCSDGTVSGSLITSTAGAGYHWVSQGVSGATASQAYTLSVFVKKGTTQYVALCEGGDAVWHVVYFDLIAGSVSGALNAVGTITPFGNGWYRVTCTFTRTNSGSLNAGLGASNGPYYPNAPAYISVGNETVYAWGAQCEVGSVATSYIATTSAAVTRAADVGASVSGTRSADTYTSPTVTRAQDLAYMQGVNLSSWFRQAEGTVVMNFSSVAPSTQNVAGNIRYLSIYNSALPAYSTEQSIYRNASSQYLDYSIRNNATGLADFTFDRTLNNQIAFSYSYTNGFTATNSGATVSSAAYSGMLPSADTMLFGGRYIADGVLGSMWIKRLAYYPKQLSASELTEITK